MNELVRLSARRWCASALLLCLSAAVRAAPVTVDLPAQPLSESILQLSRISGRGIAVDSALVKGKEAPAVRGTMEPVAALNKLLAGSGLAATVAGDDSLVISRSLGKTLREVPVVAQEPADAGSEAAGYKPDKVYNLGPMGELPIRDVPYSVSSISAPLIENRQMWRSDDIYKAAPGVQQTSTTMRNFASAVTLRGFGLSNASGKAEDGLVQQNLFPIALEDKEGVEVFMGLTGFLYGPTNVGGLLNYVYKRPTLTPLASVTVGDYGGLSGYIHGDFGGPICLPGLGPETLSYRLNVVGQGGDTSVDDQNVKRRLVTAAVTWRVTEGAAVTFIGSHADQRVEGVQEAWIVANRPDGTLLVNPYGHVPDPSRNWGQPFTSYNGKRDRAGFDLDWKLSDIFTLRAAYAHSDVSYRDNTFANNTISVLGSYTQVDAHNTDARYLANSAYALLDARFETGFVHHKVTAGFYGNEFRTVLPPTAYRLTPPNFVLTLADVPTHLPPPLYAAINSGPAVAANYNYARNGVVGDEVAFGDQWSALIGVNYAGLHGSTFNVTTRARTTTYTQSRVSPSASLIFKPLPWLSTYATYSESLQPGQVITNSGATIYTNNGQILPPFVGRQYEVGAKSEVGAMLLTGAVFELRQALQYSIYNNDNTFTYVQNGLQRNRGVELTATGNLFTGMRILAGVTLMDPQITQNQTSAAAPSIDGKLATIARQLDKLSAEYDLPFAPGLTLTGGVYYTGQQPIDRLNTSYLPSFVTSDLGLRYRVLRDLPFGSDLVARFNVTNVTDKAYWLTPSYLGQPRTFMGSVQLTF